jgi:hypothetical protein
VDDERPGFAHAFPREPKLDALVAAFERGDFGKVHREAPRLVGDPVAADDVRAAAAELLARTRPDPLSLVFFGLAALLLGVLTAYWSWKAGGPGP